MSAAEEDLDTYLPVFLYSHASFPNYDEECKVANPKVSGEITTQGLFKSFKKADDFFTTVPENMILVDPIPSGLLCVSGWSVDYLFPAIINDLGNKMFLQNELPVKLLKSIEIDSSDIDVLQHLYNNRKVYYSGNEINNYRITFDTNSGSILWGIRIPTYQNTIEMIREDWTRQYSHAKNSKCIYLDEVLMKVREFVDDIYEEKPKIMLYLVSCRGQPDYESVYEKSPRLKQSILQRQLAVNMNGINNVPYGSTTDRKLRGQKTFIYDVDDGESYQERLDKIQLDSRKRKRGGKRRCNDKRKTRKRQDKKHKKNKNSRKNKVKK